MLNGDPSRARRMSGSEYNWDKAILVKGLKNEYAKYSGSGKGGVHGGKRHVWWLRRHMRSVMITFLLLGFFFLLDSVMFSYFDPTFLKNAAAPARADAPKVYSLVCGVVILPSLEKLRIFPRVVGDKGCRRCRRRRTCHVLSTSADGFCFSCRGLIHS